MSLHTWMTPLRQGLQAAWAGRSPRERLLLAIGVWVLSLAALWMLALAPALRTWQEAPARQAQLDTILDKISKKGYDALSKAEKDFLFQQSKDV